MKKDFLLPLQLQNPFIGTHAYEGGGEHWVDVQLDLAWILPRQGEPKGLVIKNFGDLLAEAADVKSALKSTGGTEYEGPYDQYKGKNVGVMRFAFASAAERDEFKGAVAAAATQIRREIREAPSK